MIARKIDIRHGSRPKKLLNAVSVENKWLATRRSGIGGS